MRAFQLGEREPTRVYHQIGIRAGIRPSYPFEPLKLDRKADREMRGWFKRNRERQFYIRETTHAERITTDVKHMLARKVGKREYAYVSCIDEQTARSLTQLSQGTVNALGLAGTVSQAQEDLLGELFNVIVDDPHRTIGLDELALRVLARDIYDRSTQ